MAFHISNLGCFGRGITTDRNGFVATKDTDPWELDYDHGSEATHDAAGDLTEYGEWWEDERFPEIVEESTKATENSVAEIDKWRDNQ